MEQETVVVDSTIAANLSDEVMTTEYPNLATAAMKDLVKFYNDHSGLPGIRRFKTKEDGQQACQAIIAKLEGNEVEEAAEEVEAIRTEASTLSAQLIAANGGVSKTSEKNEGVWLNVKILLDEGLSNKEILRRLEEMYGNSNTTYACVAWYRNKWKKMAPIVTSEERLALWMAEHKIVIEGAAYDDLLVMLK